MADPGAGRPRSGPDGVGPPDGGAPTRVAVCVCTFRRPDSLDRLLRSLAGQRFEGEPPERELVVVDNDPDGSARPVVERWAGRIDGPVRYAVEPRRGIPHARNRALAEASDGADVIAILDDDQWAGSGWLEALLRGLVRHDADVVTGPRLPLYPGDVPGWVARAGLFAGRRWPSGREVRIAYTHNVAFRTGILDELEGWFDEALVGTGGSDTDFFHRVRLLGRKMVWIDEAVTFEPVPERRASAGWIVRRFYRFGTTAGLLQRRRETRLAGTLARTGRALGRGLLAPLRLAALPHRGRGAAVRAAADVAFSAGYLMGVAGFGYEEYGRRRQGGAEPIPGTREGA